MKMKRLCCNRYLLNYIVRQSEKGNELFTIAEAIAKTNSFPNFT